MAASSKLRYCSGPYRFLRRAGFSNGRDTRFFRTEPLPGIRIKGVIPFEAFVQTRGMTPLLPLGYKVWVDRLFDFHDVRELVFKTRYPNEPVQFTLYTLALRSETPADEILDKRPLIDRYGQWIPGNWEKKAHDDGQLRRLWDAERVEAIDQRFCPLGGDPLRTLPATGFFRTDRVDGKWVLVDPHGHAFFSAGMDLVHPEATSFATDLTRREYLFEELPGSGPAWLGPARVVSSATQERLKSMLAGRPLDAEKIKAEFLFDCARKYFETVAAAIRKYDPNHLVLGIRFAEKPSRRWAELSSVFDVFSINIYTMDFAPDPAMIREYSEASGRPVLIGEFTACAPGRGLQGLFYFTHKVRDPDERGKAYRYYVENSAASPYIVGTHWFQLVDDLPTGRPSDQERLNYGFLDVLDLPYEQLVSAARQTHQRIYDLKFGAAKPYAEKPRPN